MAMQLPALLLAAAPLQQSPVGLYEIHQMEMAGGLELRRDGHFRYALTYGAIDEESQGDWTFDGKVVRLTTKPMPKEPTFDLVSDTPAAKCTLSLSVDWGRFGWSSPPNVLVGYAAAPRELHFLQADDGGNVHLESCSVSSVRPIVPMFGIPGAALNISAATGHKLSLRFVPNDLGQAAFHGQTLRIDGPALVMDRYDAEIRFLRVGP